MSRRCTARREVLKSCQLHPQPEQHFGLIAKGLKRNLEKQVPIYEAANRTRSSVKVVVYYAAQDEKRVRQILRELRLENEESIIVIDARSDNKPSASKA